MLTRTPLEPRHSALETRHHEVMPPSLASLRSSMSDAHRLRGQEINSSSTVFFPSGHTLETFICPRSGRLGQLTISPCLGMS